MPQVLPKSEPAVIAPCSPSPTALQCLLPLLFCLICLRTLGFYTSRMLLLPLRSLIFFATPFPQQIHSLTFSIFHCPLSPIGWSGTQLSKDAASHRSLYRRSLPYSPQGREDGDFPSTCWGWCHLILTFLFTSPSDDSLILHQTSHCRTSFPSYPTPGNPHYRHHHCCPKGFLSP